MSVTSEIGYRLKRFFILSAIGLALGAVIAAGSLLSGKQDTSGNTIHFSLINQDGQAVSAADFAGKKYLFVYFGFASCPAICPTELQKMTEAYRSLPKESQNRIQPVFITVDPSRDTPKVLKNYVALFMPELSGMTGTQEQVDEAKKSFRVYATKVGEGDNYTMDHSSMMYFVGLDSQILALFKTADRAEVIKTRIMELHGLD